MIIQKNQKQGGIIRSYKNLTEMARRRRGQMEISTIFFNLPGWCNAMFYFLLLLSSWWIIMFQFVSIFQANHNFLAFSWLKYHFGIKFSHCLVICRFGLTLQKVAFHLFLFLISHGSPLADGSKEQRTPLKYCSLSFLVKSQYFLDTSYELQESQSKCDFTFMLYLLRRFTFNCYDTA